MLSRRRWVESVLATITVLTTGRRRPAHAAAAELTLPDTATTELFDFETHGIDGWTSITGQWAVEEMAGAPSGTHVLVQRATNNEFNVIVAPT